MAITTDISEPLKRAVAALKAAGAREVYVFGSAARGDLGERSDVDLAVCGLPPRAFFRAMAEAALALGRDVDLVDLDLANPFVNYLKSEGELVRVG